ncbi:acetyl-CoA synthetase-like protein [Dendrothele bispora CBS 962.96]|uniref:acetate--CoA ligase n=1 Tax=Dendrothele bispora (strain CBS 962.96) TaxID=1314807 RepID=A0A4S8L3Y1_DENBC|nr:acetyl-CoA synthetase-like protein [Dendrothele bispora CBS 962.96]
MADVPVVQKHSIGSRVAKGHLKPHVGPIGRRTRRHTRRVSERKKATETLSWYRPFQTVRSGSFSQGNIAWFPKGQLNASYNCVDRHAFASPDKTAIFYEADEPGQGKNVTYSFSNYIIYGPLTLGTTTTVFESTPVYPSLARYWETVEKHGLTHFYSAPTAIRLLRRLGHHHLQPFTLSTLRVLGSVGEPINPEAWEWYNEYVGRKECSIVDTFWQTETGSIVLTPFPGAIETKPGAAQVPFFGQAPVLVEATTGKLVEGPGEGVLCLSKPWPSIARTIWKDHARYLDTYMKPYPGYFYTGDGAARDEDGDIWIKGRVDDVINVSGHRLSTAEIESALILHKGVAETAVIGTADDLTGQAVHAFVTMKPEFSYSSSDEASLVKELVIQVRKVIGPFAAPKKVYIVGDLPKTRSGKIMRRIMRKIVAGEGDQLGDLSTVAEPSVVDQIKQKVAEE